MKIMLLALILGLSSCSFLRSPTVVAIEVEMAEIALEALLEYELENKEPTE